MYARYKAEALACQGLSSRHASIVPDGTQDMVTFTTDQDPRARVGIHREGVGRKAPVKNQKAALSGVD